VRGINNFRKRRTIYTWCRKQKADFIFLQETHSKKDSERQWKNEWGGDMIMSHGSPNSCGVAILFKKGVDCTVLSKIEDPAGRYLILKVEFKDKSYVLINLYAPNKDTDIVNFLNNLRLILQNENLDDEENIIIGGDFNCPLNPALDKKGGILLPRKSVVASIDCLCDEIDLVDIWRLKNPVSKSFTWSQNSPMIFCRLDYWLISNNLQDSVTATNIFPAIKTDHAAISLEFSTSEDHIKGPGYWKMNCSLLDDDNYLREVTEKVPIWLAEGRSDLTDHRSIWDWIKYNIRAHAVQFSKYKAMQRKEEEKILQDQFNNAKQTYESDPTDENRNGFNLAKEKMELFYEGKLQGIIIRARARWCEHGEKSTKYFLNLEKRNHVKKHVRKLKINGSFTTDPFKILSEQKRFYQDLYTSKNMSTGNTHATEVFLNNLNIPRLTDEQTFSCEGQITEEECVKALQSFQCNKAPGNDGIPVEFYNKFWAIVSEPFINCVNECFNKGEMSHSQKQAVITLIEKKGKDRSLLENWRPISLVNVDAKIISKVLATRIKNVLPSIVHHNQTGFVKDRYIGETVRSIFDLMDFSLKENIPGLMIFIDFHKAFDSLEWNFLFSCLEAFRFGPDFIRWVKTLYNNIQSCIINNGITTDYFALERGVRQGDPLSPYLFVVVVETLAIAIRQNTEINGIKIGEEETKLLQYADDTTAVLSDIHSARVLFNLLDQYKNFSGLVINSSKTEGMWIGSSRGNNSKPLGIKWPDEPIKALGVYYSYDIKLLQEKNFIERLDSVKKLINVWSLRGLSIYGKVTIIKSLIIPKFVYIFSLLPAPKEIVKELNQMIFKFLWKGTDKVTRLSTINEYENGGLRMIDLESMIKSLRLAWLKRIFGSNEGAWKSYLCVSLERFGGLFLFHCNYDIKDVHISSQFYSELLRWWYEFRVVFDTGKQWQYILWNNKEIRVNNKPIFYKNFFQKDIIHVNDLLLDMDITNSFTIISNRISKLNYLIWAGLRLSVPTHLKSNSCPRLGTSLKLTIDNKEFDVLTKKSKDYYMLIKRMSAQMPKNSQHLRQAFNLSQDQLKEVFLLPHEVTCETYIKAFQYKVLNSILFTNVKLCKIGYIQDDKCSLCKTEPETLHHLFFECCRVQQFWKEFQWYFYKLSGEFVCLTLQDVIIGIIYAKCPLLNYLLLIAKLFIWGCRRNQTLPSINAFSTKVKIKYETEKYICVKTNNMDRFNKKWAVLLDSVSF